MGFYKKYRKYSCYLLLLILTFELPVLIIAKTQQNPVLENIVDIKDFKKLLRTKTNVLVLFVNSIRPNSNIVKIFRDTAGAVKGLGTMVLVDCSTNDAKKLCKKLKINTDTYVLKHFKDGDFNKDYDRSETASSMLNFMRDPTGDLPWDEDEAAKSIYHIPDASSLSKLLRRETGPVMIMFYAPWCGFCKQLKPEYSAAAEELKGEAVLAAIDVNRPENSIVRTGYNISGFPTLIYYLNGVKKFIYEGDNNKESIVNFMKNPRSKPEKPKEVAWSDVKSEVKHLTTDTFEEELAAAESMLIMFYAPWCGHCKRMKPDYEKAAEKLKLSKINGVLAAVDATKEQALGQQFKITGYPTLKYFANGEFMFDVTLREEDKIVEFMKNPKEPPPPPKPEIPWSEEVSNVVHLTEDSFKTFLRKKKHVLVMFYAPWCGHCKKAKPEYASAAEVFQDDPKVELAAIDCTIHSTICSFYNVKGYPTIKLFHYLNKQPVQDYDGGRTKNDFIKFLSKFQTSGVSETTSESDETAGDWSNSKDIIHLNNDNIDENIKNSGCLLIYFWTPWCKHCKSFKQEYIKLPGLLKSSGLGCACAELDASAHQEVAINYDVAGFPLVKLFKNGVFIQNYVGKRAAEDIVNYVKTSPSKPVKDTTKDEL